MGQIQNVPGPSQSAFNALNDQIVNINNIKKTSGTIDNSGYANLSYPSGFTYSNCYMLGAKISNASGEFVIDSRINTVVLQPSQIYCSIDAVFAGNTITVLLFKYS